MNRTLKIGIASLADYKARTLAIAAGAGSPDPDGPKIWFSSMAGLAKVLSDKNRQLLSIIAATAPASIMELSQRTGRAPANLSRTLRTMARYGLVEFEDSAGRTRAPRVRYEVIQLNLAVSK